MSNRSLQKNPNNSAYWQSRGSDSRSIYWEEEIEKKRREGLLEYVANTSAATNKKAMGRDIVRVERIVKKVLGGDISIYKGGSQKKHTNIKDSGLDLKINVANPLTFEDRDKLRRELEAEFGSENVEVGNKVHTIRGESRNIDLFPQMAEYFSSDVKVDKLGVEPFKTNNVGRNAVRVLKIQFAEKKIDVPGIQIEREVENVQCNFKGITLDDLVQKVSKKFAF